MKSNLCAIIIVIFLFCGISFAQNQSQEGKDYPDGHGGKVHFPLGDISFADEVMLFKKGDPSAYEEDSNPKEALGIPNYDVNKDKNFVTLGCEGTLILRFVDNALVDVEGPDLYVFEIGGNIEPTSLSISKDGKSWLEIGRISGGKAAVDIGEYVDADEAFHYVKLTDLKSACGGAYPGSDIDAVGAIGSGIRVSLSSSVLFDFGQFTLKPEAKEALHNVALTMKNFREPTILIEGHTDNVGSPQSNQILSEKRAHAVKDYMVAEESFKHLTLISRGYGESRPIASNDTEEGREKNRRVEIMILPQRTERQSHSRRPKPQGEIMLPERWTTNWGTMELKQSGNEVTGRYSEDNGEVFGNLTQKNVIEGYWIEDASSRRCTKALHDRYHWGRFRMEFEQDLMSFSAVWGYCEEEPSKTDWTGQAQE